jgi:hypothetical protein
MAHLITVSSKNGRQAEEGCGEVLVADAVLGSSSAVSSPGATATESDRKGGAKRGKRKGKAVEIGAGAVVGKVCLVSSRRKGPHYRPKITANRRAGLEDRAARCGEKVGVILNEAIDRLLRGQKRGRGARTEALRSVDLLLHSVVLDLARYEFFLDGLVKALALIRSSGGLAQAEAHEYIESQLRAIFRANADLRRDMFEALRRLRVGKDGGPGS